MRANTPAVQVSAHAFEATHGRKPRGWGRWYFALDDAPFDLDHMIRPDHSMPYGEAKRWAIGVAKARGATWISVAP